ncbi:MAG: imidazoleglycerol-phosphate dehydratase HisB [bacterium]|nr:imidazoleglycerol-phosphate dehydratase HisB [bacterium]MDD3805195.1 imidazoleglycerol-phosphate dehydratase HisB [bacterium]
MPKTAEVKRKTGETDITVGIKLDGEGKYDISTTVGFLDHMLALMSRHSLIDMEVRATGDTQVDFHHLTEDTGICIGQAIAEALGDKRGIRRYGSCLLPMDEALVMAAIDLSGRPYLAYNLNIRRRRVGNFDTELVQEFFQGLANNAAATIHLKQLDGRNAHHIIEAAFKGFGRALRQAIEPDPRNSDIPSTKGML